MNEFIMT